MDITQEPWIKSNISYHKKNYKGFFEKFYEIEEIQLQNRFIGFDGKDYNGEWYKELNLEFPRDEQEPRIFGQRCKASLDFTGTNIYARIECIWGWGKCEVRIDGQKPSEMGLSFATDYIYFGADADYYGAIEPDMRFDFLIASGLSDGNHTIEFESTYPIGGNEGYVSINGFYVRTFNEQTTIDVESWLLDPARSVIGHQNMYEAKLVNTTDFPLFDVKFKELPSQLALLNQDASDFTEATLEQLQVKEEFNKPFLPTFDETFPTDTNKSFKLGLEYLIEDPTGSVTKPVEIVIDPYDQAILYTPTKRWWEDIINGYRSMSSNYKLTEMNYDFTGNAILVKFLKEYGNGAFTIYVDDVEIATVETHDSEGGNFYADYLVDGLTEGDHHLKVVTANNRKYVTFIGFTVYSVTRFTKKDIPLQFNTSLKNVPPFPPENVRLDENNHLVYDPIDANKEDLTIPRSNVGYVAEKVYGRYPTTVTMYSILPIDILKEYDHIAIDPSALSYDDVKELQNLGCLVFGYVTFGEEDGQKLNVYDESGELFPYVGDGQGVGGYASYYLKGGYQSGEMSECEHDKRTKYEVKACALGNSHYASGEARCTSACMNDWVSGYQDWNDGGSCSGGYDKNSYWDRSLEYACQNSDCPKYSPSHGKCPQYEPSEEGWLPDLTLFDKDFPDGNTIWKSYFVNCDLTTTTGWLDRLRDFYIPQVFGDMQLISENHTINDNQYSHGFRVNQYPIEIGENYLPVITNHSRGDIVLRDNLDYMYNTYTGVFKFFTQEDDTNVRLGDNVTIEYYRRGLDCDGIIMDTIDTVDIYPAPAFKEGMVNIIRILKEENPTKSFYANRGFGVLEGMAKYIDFLMFESFLVDYNWEQEVYEKVPIDEYNEGIKTDLRESRKKYGLDIISLQYCEPDQIELKEYIYNESWKLGYMPWDSTIMLDTLHHNTPVTAKGLIKTNQWRCLYGKTK